MDDPRHTKPSDDMTFDLTGLGLHEFWPGEGQTASRSPAAYQNENTATLILTVSRFSTAMPTGPAFGKPLPLTWQSLTELLQQRREGTKDGANLVYARFRPEPDGSVRRLKANLLARTAIALDCETNKATGEIPPSPRQAAARLEARGWAGVVYTSHNHTPGAPRFRIVLPISGEIAPPLPAPEVVADLLGVRGVLDESKNGASSLFYLPSANLGELGKHETIVVDSAAIDAAWLTEKAGAVLREREAEQARQQAERLAERERQRAERVAKGLPESANLIEGIRDRLDLEAELLRHGYTKIGDKFLYPASETGIPGVSLIRGSDGVERVHSFHAGDPLAAGNLPSWCAAKACDVVDVVTILDFGGDRKKALNTLATRFGIGGNKRGAEADEQTDAGNWMEQVPPIGEAAASLDATTEAKSTPPGGHDREPATSDLILSAGAPLNSARQFLARSHTTGNVRTLHHQNRTFYAWRGSHYVEQPAEVMRADLYRFLDGAKCVNAMGKLVRFDPNRRKVGDVLEAAAAEAQLTQTIRPPAWLGGSGTPKPEELIACKNTLLHLPTRQTMAHTPHFFTLNALDFDYDGNAPEPTEWLKFLATIWPSDQEAIETLREIFGLALTGDTRHQKAFLIVGPRRSGKGTIARVLTQLIGTANVCGPTLSGLATNFGLAPLIGKRLAIISDARLSGKADQQVIVERLLAITGEDSLTLDRKNLAAWTGKLDVRFMILTNELPRLTDSSGALAGRFVTLTMTQSFYGKEDLGLGARLTRELPGILLWAIDGWKRLTSRGYFVPPASSLAAQQELENLGSPVGAFLRDRCIVGQGYAVRVDDIYSTWCQWCADQGREHPGTKQVFGRDLAAAVPGLTVVKRRMSDDSRDRFYEGVTIDVYSARNP